MKGGTIHGNTAAEWDGGGVFVVKEGNLEGTFTKKGGIIYGDTDAIHTPDSAENTATNGKGHSVWTNGGKKRNTTAGPEVKLYAGHENGTWTHNDTSGGGVGDTTANWE
jgi:hypothetical protein